MASNWLTDYQTWRDELMLIIDSVKNELKSCGFEYDADSLELFKEKLLSDKFRIMVMGEFKRGKSTLINAMLGEDVLPAYSLPCTAIISEIKWGDNKSAILHFRPDCPSNDIDYLRPEAKQHIQKYINSDKIPPLIIDHNYLEDYITIPTDISASSKQKKDNPFSHVELFWPLSICQDGVEIIDSPGLNENPVRAQITSSYLTKTDAIVFVFICEPFGSITEIHFIENYLVGAGYEDLFFVCNKINLIREKERPRLVDHVKSTLLPHTKLGDDGIFFVSALDALDGRIENQEQRVNQSGVPQFEDSLATFLNQKRGKLKLKQPANNIKSIINIVATQKIPSQLNLSSIGMKELSDRYKKAKPQLDAEERRIEQIINGMIMQKRRLLNNIAREVDIWIGQITLDLPKWVANLELDNSLKLWKTEEGGVLPVGFKTQAEQLVKEIVDKTTKYIETQSVSWTSKHFQPYLENEIIAMFSAIQSDLNASLERIDRIRADISHIDGTQENPTDISTTERIAAAAGGLVLGGFGSAFVGSVLGGKEMFKSLIPSIAIVVGGIMLGIANPLVLLPLLLGAGFVQNLWGLEKANSKIKQDMGEKIAQEIRNMKSQVSNDVVKQVDSIVGEHIDGIQAGLTNELVTLRSQVERTLQEMNAGRFEYEKSKTQLENANKELKLIEDKLDSLLIVLNN